MSAQAKTFLDRLNDLLSFHRDDARRLRGKRLAVLCSGTDPKLPDSFDEPFGLTCAYLGIEFLGTHCAQFHGLRPVHASAGGEAASFARHLRQGALP